MHRTLTALAGTALAALVAATAAPAAADNAHQRSIRATGPSFVHDVRFSDVAADVHAVTTAHDTTVVTLRLGNLPAHVRGTVLGAHVHVGACGASPTASGPHYGNPSAPATIPLHDREIWLDLDVNAAGQASSQTSASWVIAPGAARSVVVHAQPTDHTTGGAGARLLCIDVPFGHVA